MNNENLKKGNRFKSGEDAAINGSKGGKASQAKRRAQKNMKETAQAILSLPVVGENNRKNLSALGIDEQDQNYRTAVIARLVQKAITTGDANAVRLLGEMAGEVGPNTVLLKEEQAEAEYPVICIPSNGRDERTDNTIAAQAGPQTAFMASAADIIIYGGAAGGGKTYALLLEGLRHKDVDGFGAVIFRQSYTQITAEGGLWDASHKIYGSVKNAEPKKTPKLHWSFGGKGKLHFAHLNQDDDLLAWQGTEIAYIGFDELTHFTKRMFFYMLSRNRSTCGVKPYIRATCNPDSDSWVASFISWWINQDTGYPIYERSGLIRYMCVVNDNVYWANTPQELVKEHHVEIEECKSVTFIASKLTDNRILIAKDPSYMSNLKALPEVDKERLLYGNWKIRPSAGMYFRTEQFEVVEVAPKCIAYVRAWDLAATEPSPSNPNPDATAGVLMGKLADGRYIVLDVKRKQIKANDVRNLMRNVAAIDNAKYGYVEITIPQDPGQAGKAQSQSLVSLLSGYSVEAVPPTGSKQLRATPYASQVQAGNVMILKGEWNESYLNELESFPEALHDDMVDASSDAFNKLQRTRSWKGLIE